MSRAATANQLRELADALSQRLEGSQGKETRAAKGQFATPSEAAATIAALFDPPEPGSRLRVLDPGAGAGSLTLALVADWIERGVELTASFDLVETDPAALTELRTATSACEEAAAAFGLDLKLNIHQENFCDVSSWNPKGDSYDIVIANPPYQKLRKDSDDRRLVLKRLGADSPNLYAAFLAVATSLLAPGGSMVAITPRSFANGLYFTNFRHYLLSLAAFRHVVLFDRRDKIFKSSSVLQETVIFRMDRAAVEPSDSVRVETRVDHVSEPIEVHDLDYSSVVALEDPDLFINLPGSSEVIETVRAMTSQPTDLKKLGLAVSTGPVVDFRAKDALVEPDTAEAVPLIYPTNLKSGSVEWPVQTKKSQGFLPKSSNSGQLMPNGFYVLVKRFSAKEERRRVVASVYSPIPGYREVAFENHLNVIHRNRQPISEIEAKQIADYLNSDLVDTYFRVFSGSTQVNATDVRRLHFPAIEGPVDDEEIDLRETPTLFPERAAV